MALRPHWLDSVIDKVVRKDDANEIAKALAHSDRMQNAILDGIETANRSLEGMRGPSRAQHIRQAICAAIASDS